MPCQKSNASVYLHVIPTCVHWRKQPWHEHHATTSAKMVTESPTRKTFSYVPSGRKNCCAFASSRQSYSLPHPRILSSLCSTTQADRAPSLRNRSLSACRRDYRASSSPESDPAPPATHLNGRANQNESERIPPLYNIWFLHLPWPIGRATQAAGTKCDSSQKTPLLPRLSCKAVCSSDLGRNTAPKCAERTSVLCMTSSQ